MKNTPNSEEISTDDLIKRLRVIGLQNSSPDFAKFFPENRAADLIEQLQSQVADANQLNVIAQAFMENANAEIADLKKANEELTSKKARMYLNRMISRQKVEIADLEKENEELSEWKEDHLNNIDNETIEDCNNADYEVTNSNDDEYSRGYVDGAHAARENVKEENEALTSGLAEIEKLINMSQKNCSYDTFKDTALTKITKLTAEIE